MCEKGIRNDGRIPRAGLVGTLSASLRKKHVGPASRTRLGGQRAGPGDTLSATPPPAPSWCVGDTGLWRFCNRPWSRSSGHQ
ncbi:hypothetical protein AAFF_G00434060 [Aldrovandia affinis]|uniref:Uncharacterized protein n=1 Tax=Aldrovandia affinis TaxID=143900 RepID=A0AAD7S8L3_9TELE|nr:hypothetical protein AAFF_G00434060 [Aldrovandia affinis]